MYFTFTPDYWNVLAKVIADDTNRQGHETICRMLLKTIVKGGGSLTAIADYWKLRPVDVFRLYSYQCYILFTDGQIFLTPRSFNQGVRPAINPPPVGPYFLLSVSRVGG